METIKTVLAVVGAVVVTAVAVISTIKVLAKYGSHITMACRRADQVIKEGIRKVA